MLKILDRDEKDDPDQKLGNSKGKNRSQLCSTSDPAQLGECSTKLGQLFILSCNLKLHVLYPPPNLNKLDFVSVVLNEFQHPFWC